jgi:hypothetical protein
LTATSTVLLAPFSMLNRFCGTAAVPSVRNPATSPSNRVRRSRIGLTRCTATIRLTVAPIECATPVPPVVLGGVTLRVTVQLVVPAPAVTSMYSSSTRM